MTHYSHVFSSFNPIYSAVYSLNTITELYQADFELILLQLLRTMLKQLYHGNFEHMLGIELYLAAVSSNFELTVIYFLHL